MLFDQWGVSIYDYIHLCKYEHLNLHINDYTNIHAYEEEGFI